jgi:DNA-binding MarR family transcriptional regulator
MPLDQPVPDAADAMPDHKLSLRLWLRLLGCSTVIEKAVRARLAAEFDATLPRFDVLSALERHPQGLQLGELSRLLLVSNGNVTGVIARLVAEGLVDRRVDPNDARVARVSLTPQGRAAFLTMAAAHEIWIESMFEGLGREDQSELLTLLTRLRRVLARTQRRGPAARDQGARQR